MSRRKFLGSMLAAGCVALWGGVAHADEYSARLSGFNVTGGLGAGETGAILTNATGRLQLDLDRTSQTATYTLSFSGTTSAVTMAHIHLGKVHVAGGIMVWLCQTTAKQSPVASTPYCPATGGSVSGTITAASIVAIPGQNVTAGNFGELVAALATKTAYVNVHTVNFPAGEIRGQIKGKEHRDR
ncbi:MAG: CHRD domain-containing protein [Stellaceae bacterium]